MSKDDSHENPFQTGRMQTMSGLNPDYVPGEFVYLNGPVPGFAEGTRFKIVSAQSVSSGLFRYELSAQGQTVWVMQDQLRQSPPDSVMQSPASQLPSRGMSMTQRMQTMTLSQRMAALGLDKPEPEPGPTATQRMNAIKPGAAPPAVPDAGGPVTGALDLRGPITGSPLFDGPEKRGKGKR